MPDGETTRAAIPNIPNARYWADATGRLVDFAAAHPQRCHVLTYEDLCAEPEATLKPLFSFLGEGWEPDVLRFGELPHDHGAEDGWVASSGGFRPSSGRYEGWDAPITDACVAIVTPSMPGAGYRPGSSGDR